MQHSPADAHDDPSGNVAPSRVALGLFAAMRPRQWVKNVLVGVAPVAAGEALHRTVFWHTAVAFLAFCLASSGTYLVNDVRDRDADRRHPTKSRRPVAAGVVPVGLATGSAVLLLAAGLSVAASINWRLCAVVAIYVAASVAYSLGVKRWSVIELGFVAAGFVLRAIAGGVANGIPLSSWFLVVISFGALFVVVGKRLAEFHELGEGASEHRAVLDVYTRGFLEAALTLCAGVTVTGYCLWAFAIDANGLGVHHDPLWIQLSVIPVVLAILHVLLELDAGRGGAPEDLLLRDRTVQVLGVIWAVLVAIGVYR